MSIFDSIGGSPAVQAAVDDFYTSVLADPQLAPYFTDVDMRHLKAHQRAFIAAAIGGPQIYSGRDMAAAHRWAGHHRRGLRRCGGPPRRHAGQARRAGGDNGQIGGALAPLRSDIVTAPPEELAS